MDLDSFPTYTALHKTFCDTMQEGAFPLTVLSGGVLQFKPNDSSSCTYS